MNHAGIAKIGKDYADKEILYEMKYGVVDTSNCDNILRVSPHHNGAVEQHGQVSAMLKKEARWVTTTDHISRCRSWDAESCH